MHLNQFKSGLVLMALLLRGTFAYGAVTQICDSVECQPLTYFDRQAVLEKLTEMFKDNADQILVCQANAETKTCLPRPLTFAAQTSMMEVDFQLPFVRILQKERLSDGFSLFLDYQVRANEKYPKCSASVSSFVLLPQGEIRLMSPSFECHATELGSTFLNFQFQVDYINFATGWLGASYQATSSGDILGESSGYVMMKVSSERSIQLRRPQPMRSGALFQGDDRMGSPQYVHETGKLVDWDKENIKTKWNTFKEKFLKILYLEPLE